ncbi:hypothetical protein RFI_06937, partial [Reticulomyxa filosa]
YYHLQFTRERALTTNEEIVSAVKERKVSNPPPRLDEHFSRKSLTNKKKNRPLPKKPMKYIIDITKRPLGFQLRPSSSIDRSPAVKTYPVSSSSTTSSSSFSSFSFVTGEDNRPTSTTSVSSSVFTAVTNEPTDMQGRVLADIGVDATSISAITSTITNTNANANANANTNTNTNTNANANEIETEADPETTTNTNAESK